MAQVSACSHLSPGDDRLFITSKMSFSNPCKYMPMLKSQRFASELCCNIGMLLGNETLCQNLDHIFGQSVSSAHFCFCRWTLNDPWPVTTARKLLINERSIDNFDNECLGVSGIVNISPIKFFRFWNPVSYFFLNNWFGDWQCWLWSIKLMGRASVCK